MEEITIKKSHESMKEAIQGAKRKYWKVQLESGHICTLGAFLDANGELDPEDTTALYNLNIGDSVALNWMGAPVVTRIE